MNKEHIDQVSDVKMDCLEPKLDTERPRSAQPGTTMENYYGFLIISQQLFEVGFYFFGVSKIILDLLRAF